MEAQPSDRFLLQWFVKAEFEEEGTQARREMPHQATQGHWGPWQPLLGPAHRVSALVLTAYTTTSPFWGPGAPDAAQASGRRAQLRA